MNQWNEQKKCTVLRLNHIVKYVLIEHKNVAVIDYVPEGWNMRIHLSKK